MTTTFDQFDYTNWLLHVLTKAGIEDIIISPGSRNAPLMIALIKHFPNFKLHSVVDERSAGFKAIGIADVTQKPVALICTSGTAAANYLPAVCEAWFRSVPLIVITADRPIHLTTARDGQTIFQHHLYGRHVDAFWYLSENLSAASLIENLRDIYLHIIHQRRPIHINVHYEEPLYRWKDLVEPPFSLTEPQRPKNWNKPIDLSGFRKIMIVVGQCRPGYISKHTQQFLNDKGYPLVSGGLSNLHPDLAIYHVNEFDYTTLPEPELVITVGGEITHKNLKKYLRSIPTLTHWHVEDIPYPPDTFGKGVRLIPTDASEFLKRLADLPVYLDNSFSQTWYTTDRSYTEAYLKNEEIKKFYAPIAKAAQNRKAKVVLGNSAVIRQFFKLPGIWQQNIYGNRGTAGIDGSLSTAVGMAMASDAPVWCLLGDLSFFYDINALWQNPMPKNLTVFVFNNKRGKIFEMIAGPGDFPEIYALQTTPHSFTCNHLAKHFSMNYVLWNGEDDKLFETDLSNTIVEISLT
ncbi:2-succinyl-5-enolpyruvyl-6-hydroxy-3-cyclohexene- 1-carboxylate synthase [Thermaurantimonas aggregans]|uniref:2-succinyl-5-enolpyruvyl-6-hydroxy-3-cyclohexene-1-carboxylate synthase n=1 Tax=Thermaurantimonas aggregans TaxID=2173829 RepID=A0A401XLR6_9FLAO|nr:2-succinyl-5-enolpyruvyl-6-hydroxy-3-cyclohexene-1-carboxylic-acid synthase [Thermaurantimonas aggregans]MCX8147808.1 2-succinyl-5-enolpyruvyl-6-hydroxy-3-cyclohexene-1-carboxylic-acid synthase [Thermaurantimonas aggregans]GCD77942.1 2-succinyl-5-enolpyruvyl-6-hydroxy-3-cyclohexene- 1-carboxylate synthase [Thermaurantimonas aggregans]